MPIRLGLVLFAVAATSCARARPRPPSPLLPPARTHGGMWMPEQLPAFASELTRLGLALEPVRLADPTLAPLAAVVSLGGCSASFVSPQGLIITNHHCVSGALQFNSTPGRNLLEQGFLAETLDQEVWAGPTARVYVTRALVDVSEEITADLANLPDPLARQRSLTDHIKRLVQACERPGGGLRCEIRAFDEGARYVRVEQLELRDVRLVYAPPEGIGVFGGDIDNWRWPRHTGDFAFLRAYVGPDGEPADHGPHNVPFAPPHHLPIATMPLRAGDFVMVAGYPGATYRHRLADDVANEVDWFYPHFIEMLQVYRDTLINAVGEDPRLRIKAASRLQGLTNSLINAQGTLEGLRKGSLVRQKRLLEAELRGCLESKPALAERFGDVLPGLRALAAEIRADQKRDRAIKELLRGSQLLDAALTLVRLAEERAKPDADREPGFQARDERRIEQRLQALSASYARPLDEAVFRLFVRRALALPEPDRPERALRQLFGGTLPAAAEVDAALDRVMRRLYEDTALSDETRRVRLAQTADLQALRTSEDPFIQLALAWLPWRQALELKQKRWDGRQAILRPAYMAALRACTDKPIASDANATLRLTFGTVTGYRPRPTAPVYAPFTTLPQMLAKHRDESPFDLPDLLLQAAREAGSSPYRDRALGEIPVNFLADLDITGGSSGSPTLNGEGALVGVVFDGNYEAIASDWVFMPEVTRSIHVDVRFVLWVLDSVAGAHHLLREMNVTPAGLR